MGWVEIAEEDLTPERSSKAVNKCILDLSFGKNDLLDVIGRWGDVSARFEYLIPHIQFSSQLGQITQNIFFLFGFHVYYV